MWKSNEFHKFYISNNSKLKKKVYVSNVTEKSFPIDLAKKRVQKALKKARSRRYLSFHDVFSKTEFLYETKNYKIKDKIKKILYRCP